MQTKKLALLSTMLVGLAGAAWAAEATDAAKDAVKPAVEEVQQQAMPAERQDAAASRCRSRRRAGSQGPRMPWRRTRTPSIGTSDQAYAGEVLAGMTAEDVIGMTVVDANGEEVGEVADLLIAEDGTIDRAIVDVGGFLGFATKPVALEITSLTLAEGSGEIVSDVTAETLEGMPEWQQDDDGWFSF